MLSNRKLKKYPEHVETQQSVLDPNSSLTKMVELIGERKRVLDIGCASGYLARLLTQRDCDVVGIDVSPSAVEAARAFCTRAIVADLDVTPLLSLVDQGSFDVIVCGDVLEHLRYPTRLLEDARAALREGGSLVASIPNIAHGAIRLALLEGSFDYQELGILDDTHLRFFTAKTVDELFVCAGYRIEQIERTTLPLFEVSDLVPPVLEENYGDEVIAKVRRDPEAETLQFVVKATPLSDDLASRAVAKRFLEVNTELSTLKLRIEKHATQLQAAEVAADELRGRTVAAEKALALAESANVRFETGLTEALGALAVAADDRDEGRRLVAALRAEADATGRLNVGLVAELRAASASIATLEGALETAATEAAAAQAAALEASAATQAAVLESAAAQAAVLESAAAQAAALESAAEQALALDAATTEIAALKAALEAGAEIPEETREELAQTIEDLKTERARYDELSERFTRHVELGIDRARTATSELATQIDQIQTGRIWRFKNVLRRMFRRGARV